MTAEMDKSTPKGTHRSTLRRSRTITCNVYPAVRPIQDAPVDDRSREVTPEDRTSPKSSCQALRHAVSALTRLDDFICEKIGAGFFSEVFKVTHRITGQVMALKMNTMTSNRHNMLREVQLLNRLSHPNILRFMGVCVHEGQLHALTEFIPGGSLEQLLANKDEELPWTQRIHLTLGVARGLNYLHSRGFLHRDLTSKNILIKKENKQNYRAVIADFGLAAKIPNPLSNEKLPIVGSPFWMAPEVLCGEFYDEKADLFSVGIIMCEITARISADPDEMPRMQNFGVDYVALSEMIAYCPLDYLQLAFKCCQVDPSKRPAGIEIIEWLEKIYKNLQNDIFTRQEKENTERNGYKRSRSEDNILQANDSDADTSSEDIVITPLLIGQVMSRDDPFYAPSSTNPFAAIQHFRHGRKLLGTSVDYSAELPSPATTFTPPCTPGCGDPRRNSKDGFGIRRCQSLPSSPVLLRRAAEKMHQESLHGSVRYCLQSQQTPPAMRARSKSTVFSDAVAQRLQMELSKLGPPLVSTFIPELQVDNSTFDLQNSNKNCKVNKKKGSRFNTGFMSVEQGQQMTCNMVAPSAPVRRRVRKTVSHGLDNMSNRNVNVHPQSCQSNVNVHPQSCQSNGFHLVEHDHHLNGTVVNGLSAVKGSHSSISAVNGSHLSSNAGQTVETEDNKSWNRKEQREISPASIRSSCESFMSLDEHGNTTPPSSLSSFGENLD